MIRGIKSWDFSLALGMANLQAVVWWMWTCRSVHFRYSVQLGVWWNLSRRRGSTPWAQWVRVIFALMLERVSLSLLLLPSGYCGEINVVVICGPPFRGFPHPSPPASSSFLSRRLLCYLPSHTFFCSQLPILKELKFSVWTWGLGINMSCRVKSLCVMGGSAKLCYSVWFMSPVVISSMDAW